MQNNRSERNTETIISKPRIPEEDELMCSSSGRFGVVSDNG